MYIGHWCMVVAAGPLLLQAQVSKSAWAVVELPIVEELMGQFVSTPEQFNSVQRQSWQRNWTSTLINELSWGDGAAMSPPGTLLMTQKGGRQTFENKRSYKEHGGAPSVAVSYLESNSCHFILKIATSWSLNPALKAEAAKARRSPGSRGLRVMARENLRLDLETMGIHNSKPTGPWSKNYPDAVAPLHPLCLPKMPAKLESSPSVPFIRRLGLSAAAAAFTAAFTMSIFSSARENSWLVMSTILKIWVMQDYHLYNHGWK